MKKTLLSFAIILIFALSCKKEDEKREGIAGHFIDPDNNKVEWGYENGSSKSQNTIIVKVTEPYKLLTKNPKVAVLTDNATGSSGEAITIAFKNRPNTKSFGLPTCGLSTANQGFTLSDKGQLLLTTSTMADRNSNKYGAEVAPDLMESDPSLMVQKAVEWILN